MGVGIVEKREFTDGVLKIYNVLDFAIRLS